MTDTPDHCDTPGEIPPVPPWQLERYLLAELPDRDMRKLELALNESAGLRERLEVLRRDNGDALRHHPAAWMARQIAARASAPGRIQTQRRASVRWWGLVPAAAAALAAVAVLPSLGPEQTPAVRTVSTALESVPPGVRLKGAPYLVLHRKTATGSERLDSGAPAYAGDLVLVQYHGAGRSYGAILSVDGRGAVTVHLPAEGDAAAVLDDSGLATMGYSYELDDAPRRERFYLITSERPFGVAEAAATVRQDSDSPDLGAPNLPADLERYIFDLNKDAAPRVSSAAEAQGR